MTQELSVEEAHQHRSEIQYANISRVANTQTKTLTLKMRPTSI
jgi:hypothetical protein